ncbi:hypothetical protein DZG00_12800, partial [Clavibacter lycopersici]
MAPEPRGAGWTAPGSRPSVEPPWTRTGRPVTRGRRASARRPPPPRRATAGRLTGYGRTVTTPQDGPDPLPRPVRGRAARKLAKAQKLQDAQNPPTPEPPMIPEAPAQAAPVAAPAASEPQPPVIPAPPAAPPV